MGAAAVAAAGTARGQVDTVHCTAAGGGARHRQCQNTPEQHDSMAARRLPHTGVEGRRRGAVPGRCGGVLREAAVGRMAVVRCGCNGMCLSPPVHAGQVRNKITHFVHYIKLD